MKHPFYRVEIAECESVTEMGICAIDKHSAVILLLNRLKDCGYTVDEYKVKSVRREGFCNWPLNNTLIYF